MIVSQGQSSQVILPAGQQLTVIADANCSGIVYRSGGSQSAVAASATVVLGPFATTEVFDVVPTVGFLTHTQAPSLLDADGTIQTQQLAALAVTGAKLAFPKLGVISETVGFAAFTDGLGAVGTYVMTVSLPAKSIFLYSKVKVPAGFAGNVSAVLTIGDGSDVDRYNTGTPSVFTTAANGIEMGAPSGTRYHATAMATVTLTVTGATDFTAINAGSIAVSLYYLDTE